MTGRKITRLLKMLSVLAFFVISFAAKAQTSPNQLPSDKKYVRIDIGHGALHCPFLSPKLETRLKAVKDINNFFIDKRSSYITFELPAATEMTIESLKEIGTEVGYPAADVIVSMDTKPIKTASN